MLASSSAEVRPGKTETQQLRVMANPNVRFSLRSARTWVQLLTIVSTAQSQIRLRLRIAYTTGGTPRQDQTDFSFPAELMAA